MISARQWSCRYNCMDALPELKKKRMVKKLNGKFPCPWGYDLAKWNVNLQVGKTWFWTRPCLLYEYESNYKIIIIIIMSCCQHSTGDLPSLSSITSGRSSRLHPVSAQSCCIWVLAGRPVFARLCEGVNRSMSIVSSSLRLQQCPACLVHLTWIVFVMGGKWPYSGCFVGCCLQDLFNIARSILV